MMRSLVVATAAVLGYTSATAEFAVPVGAKWSSLLLESSFGEEDVVVIVDLDASATLLTEIKASGAAPVCSFSVGRIEARQDVQSNLDAWKAVSIGGQAQAGDLIDISKFQQLKALFAPRFQAAKSRGCHAVLPMDLDCFNTDACWTAIDATDQAKVEGHQIAWSAWLSMEAQRVALGIGLHDSPELVPKLYPLFDFYLGTDCLQNNECGQLQPFAVLGKGIMNIESSMDASSCKQAEEFQTSTIFCTTGPGSSSERCFSGSGAWQKCFDLTAEPTKNPSRSPTRAPTGYPTRSPSRAPVKPTVAPTKGPTERPTAAPSNSPTKRANYPGEPFPLVVAMGTSKEIGSHGPHREYVEIDWRYSLRGSKVVLNAAAILEWRVFPGEKELQVALTTQQQPAGTWLSIGICPTGEMVGSRVVLGAVKDDNDGYPTIGEYILRSRDINGLKISKYPSILQSASFTQQTSTVRLAFRTSRIADYHIFDGLQPQVPLTSLAPTARPTVFPTTLQPPQYLPATTLPQGVVSWANLAWGASGIPTDDTDGAQIVLIDLHKSWNATQVAEMRARGHLIFCSFSAGALERDRPDYISNRALWESLVLDPNNVNTRQGQPWLDIRKLPVIKQLMENRVKEAASLGCHGIDPGDLNCIENSDCAKALENALVGEGRRVLSLMDDLRRLQHEFTSWFAKIAGIHRLFATLRDLPTMAKDLIEHGFHVAIAHECISRNECKLYKDFIDRGLPLLNVEYGGKTCLTSTLPVSTKVCTGSSQQALCSDEWENCFADAQLTPPPSQDPNSTSPNGTNVDPDQEIPIDEAFAVMHLLLGLLLMLLVIVVTFRFRTGSVDLGLFSEPDEEDLNENPVHKSIRRSIPRIPAS